MANPLARLERAYDEVMEATDEDFFRRLRDYMGVLETDKKIHKAVDRLTKEVVDAEVEFQKENEKLVAELVALRNQLVEREPKADDSEETRPPDAMDPAGAARFDSWIWTLANFDAVVGDSKDKIIERDGLDNSSSRMLVAILYAKLYDLVLPSGSNPAPRPDLRDLYKEVNSIGHRQTAAHRQLEQVGQESGYLALRHIEKVVSYLGPKPVPPSTTREAKKESIEAALVESWGGFGYLRQAMRPKEARGSLDEDAQKALNTHEKECRTELDRLHRPLRQKLETGRRWTHWSDYSRAEKIGVWGVGGTFLAIVVAVVIAA